MIRGTEALLTMKFYRWRPNLSNIMINAKHKQLRIKAS